MRSPPAELRVALVYGPDEGLVRERAKCLGETVVTDLADPFVAELSGGDLTADPARLADEVAAISLTGGRRLIRIRDVGDAAPPILKSVLETGPGDTMTVPKPDTVGPALSAAKASGKPHRRCRHSVLCRR